VSAPPPFQELIDAHGRTVHRFLVATVGAMEADDCYQETFLAALRAYPRVRDAGNLRGWLLTIAHRKAIDAARARRRRATPVDPGTIGAQARSEPSRGGPPDGPAPGGANPAQALPADGELWARVAALPSKQRTALALRYIGDCDYRQIAQTMRTSPEAARRNVHEGLRQLRQQAAQAGHTEDRCDSTKIGER